MPRSVITLPKELLTDFRRWLHAKGYEINDSENGWRIFMYKHRDVSSWTQGYDGLTSKSKNSRIFVRFAGPEAYLVTEFLATIAEKKRIHQDIMDSQKYL